MEDNKENMDSEEQEDIEVLDGDGSVNEHKKKFKLFSFKTRKDIITSIIMMAAIVVIIIAVVNIARIMMGYKESSDTYKQLENSVIVEDDKKKTLNLNFDELLKVCPDAEGWIWSEGILSYPIVQCGDNETYLHHLYDGKTYNGGGTLFIDYRIPEGINARNPIVYGHNMMDGSMFGNLGKYLDPEFIKQHPTFEVYVGPDKYIYKIFSVYVTDELSDAYQMGYSSDEDYQNYINRAINRSYCDCGVEVTAGDNIMTLSTCHGAAGTDQRLLVHLVRGEKMEGSIEGYETVDAKF